MRHRWRKRFGITAARVTVRTHLPWYWRSLGVVVVLAVSFALAGWIYDAGRRLERFLPGQTEQTVASLRARVAKLTREIDGLRRAADASGSKLRIELTAEQQLARQVRKLEDENVQLKEDLSVFENLAQAEGPAGSLSINGLRVEAEGHRRYHYRMLVAMQAGRREREFKGSVQLAITLQQGGRRVMMLVPAPRDPKAKKYLLDFKHFRRVEGDFTIPSGTRVKSVEVRLLRNGELKVSKRVAM